MELIILAAVLFALVTTIIANNKGRNVFSWFCIGLITGPIGLTLSLLLAENKKVVDEITID